MLLYKFRKSDSIFEKDEVNVYYVDGAYITAVILFLAFGAIAIPAMMLMGIAVWAARHMAVVFGVIAIAEVILLCIELRCNKRRHMLFSCLGTLFLVVSPVIGTLAYTYPITQLGEPMSAALSVIFSLLLFYGGAFMVFKINRLLTNGLVCFGISLLLFVLSVLIAGGFRAIDAKAFEGIDIMALYSFWT